MTASASRVSEAPGTLQIARTLPPALRAARTAPIVSAVSPDCEIATKSVSPSMTGRRYRDSEATSTSTGTRASASIMYFAASAACQEVPQPSKSTRRARASRAASRPVSRRSPSSRAASTRGEIVMPIARGCSWISLSMKCG